MSTTLSTIVATALVIFANLLPACRGQEKPPEVARRGNGLYATFGSQKFSHYDRPIYLAFDERETNLICVTGTGGAIWQVPSGKLKKRMYAGGWSAAYSSKGQLLAIGRMGGEIDVLDLKTGISVAQFAAGGSIREICFSPDGERLAAASDEVVSCFRLDKKQLEATIPLPIKRGVRSIALFDDKSLTIEDREYRHFPWTPDGHKPGLALPAKDSLLSVNGDKAEWYVYKNRTIEVWNPAEKKRIRVEALESLPEGPVSAMSWSRDGETGRFWLSWDNRGMGERW